jgi:hypothetical protein
MTEPNADAHITALMQSINKMLEALHMMTLGQLVPTIILRNPVEDRSSVVASADQLPELADYLQRIRDARLTPMENEIERKH